MYGYVNHMKSLFLYLNNIYDTLQITPYLNQHLQKIPITINVTCGTNVIKRDIIRYNPYDHISPVITIKRNNVYDIVSALMQDLKYFEAYHIGRYICMWLWGTPTKYMDWYIIHNNATQYGHPLTKIDIVYHTSSSDNQRIYSINWHHQNKGIYLYDHFNNLLKDDDVITITGMQCMFDFNSHILFITYHKYDHDLLNPKMYLSNAFKMRSMKNYRRLFYWMLNDIKFSKRNTKYGHNFHLTSKEQLLEAINHYNHMNSANLQIEHHFTFTKRYSEWPFTFELGSKPRQHTYPKSHI